MNFNSVKHYTRAVRVYLLRSFCIGIRNIVIRIRAGLCHVGKSEVILSFFVHCFFTFNWTMIYIRWILILVFVCCLLQSFGEKPKHSIHLNLHWNDFKVSRNIFLTEMMIINRQVCNHNIYHFIKCIVIKCIKKITNFQRDINRIRFYFILIKESTLWFKGWLQNFTCIQVYIFELLFY